MRARIPSIETEIPSLSFGKETRQKQRIGIKAASSAVLLSSCSKQDRDNSHTAVDLVVQKYI